MKTNQTNQANQANQAKPESPENSDDGCAPDAPWRAQMPHGTKVPVMGVYRLTKAVKIPQRDKRKKLEIWALEKLPAGTRIVLRKGVSEGAYEVTVDPSGLKAHYPHYAVYQERLHWRMHPTRERGDNYHLGWDLMDVAELVDDGFRTAYLRAIGDDPFDRFHGSGSTSLLERLFTQGYVTERMMRHVADGPPCPVRSDSGFPCARSTISGKPHDGEHDFS